MTIDIQYEHGHAAWTWSKDKYMLLIHVYLHAAYSCPFCMFQYILHVPIHAACPCSCRMSMDTDCSMDMYIQCVQIHSAWTWSCSIDTSLQYGHGPAVNMDMHGLVPAACPCPCCISSSMMHVLICAVSPCPCCKPMSI
jgi:hypothetical protein